MTEEEIGVLMDKFESETMICSFLHHAMKQPSWAKIQELGEEVVPFIVARLKSKGPDIMLEIITKVHLEHNQEKVAPGWVGINVKNETDAWIKWWEAKQGNG